MANEIDILLGGGMTPQNTDTEAMAAALRGQLREGNALGMSTIGGVARYGQNQAQAARQGARQAGRLKQALEKEARDRENMLEDEERAFKLWKKKQDYRQQQDLDFEKFKQEVRNEKEPVDDGKLKPTGKAVQDYTKGLNLISQINSVLDDSAKFTKEQREMVDNPEADILTEWLPDSVARYAQDQYIYNDPDVKNYRAKTADIESEFSKLMSGLAVTGFEMTDRQKWSPFASGISQDTRTQRLGNLKDKLSQQKDIAEKTYKLGNIANQSVPSSIARPQVTMAELAQMGGDINALIQEAESAGYEVVE